MSHRFIAGLAVLCIVLIAPAFAGAQSNRHCQSSASSMSMTPKVVTNGSPSLSQINCSPSRTAFQMSITPGSMPTPNSIRTPNLSTSVRRTNQPIVTLSRQQDPQMQQALTQNLLMQQTMMNEQLNQYRLQDMVKQQLLQYAIDAPTENLERELKNSNAFVRWAASVELNRRWRLEKSVADAEKRARKQAPAAPPDVPVLPRVIRAETPAVVSSAPTSSDQALLLQFGIPNSQ